MLRKFKKITSVCLSTLMVLSLVSFNSKAEEQIKEINVNIELEIGKKLKEYHYTVSPDIPIYNANNNRNSLQMSIGFSERVCEIEGRNVPFYDACEKNEDGSIKTDSNGTYILKKGYSIPKDIRDEETKTKAYDSAIKVNTAYILSLSFSVGDDKKGVFPRKLFSNEISQRTVSVDGTEEPVPRFTLNGKEIFISNFDGLENTINSSPNKSKAEGLLVLYPKTTISPNLKLNIDKDIDKLELPEGESIEELKNINIKIDDEDVDKYYLKSKELISKEDGSSDWTLVKDLEKIELSKNYATKLVISPKIFYKFNQDKVGLQGNIDRNKAEISKENQDITIILPFNKAKHVLNNDDIEIEIKRPREGELQSINAEIVKGDEYVTVSEITWYKDSSTSPLGADEKFEKGVKYQARLDINPKDTVIYNDEKIEKIKLNGEEQLVIHQPSKPSNYIKINKDFDVIPKPVVEYVEISPKDASVEISKTTGAQLQYNSKVYGSNMPSQLVSWSIENNESADTMINKMNGLLKISPKETSNSITIKAVSKEDMNITTSTMLTIKNPYVKPLNYTLVLKGQMTAKVDNFVVNSNETVEENKEVIISLDIPKDKEVDKFTVNNEDKKSMLNNNMYKFNIMKDTTVEVVYKDKAKQESKKVYNLNLKGQMTAKVDNLVVNSNETVEENKEVIISLDIPKDKEVDKFTVNNEDKKSMLNNNMYKFNMMKDTTVEVIYKNKYSSSSTSDVGSGSGSSSSSNTDKKQDIKKDMPKNTENNKVEENKSEFLKLKLENVISSNKANETVSNFSDTNEITWSRKHIEKVIEKGLMAGYEDGSFRPKMAVTRAQVSQVISQAFLKNSNNTSKKEFNDVKKDSWYYNAVSKVLSSNIFGGYEDNTFRPDAQITREELFTAMAKALDLKPLNKEESKKILSKFEDSEKISSWAQGYVSALVEKEIVKGANNKISPNMPITREELTVIFSNIIE